jgi:hypothetical protein
MKGWGLLALAGFLAVTPAEAGRRRAVVADLPYQRVWEAAVRAVDGFPVERAADGLIVTGRRERPARPDEAATFSRVAERAVIRVESFGTGSTRVTVDVEVSGWRDGAWVAIPDGEEAAQAILDRLAAG